MRGPFKNIPFEYYIQSPIGLVPKDSGKDTRLIFHLSYPRNKMKESVNANTDPAKCKVKYPDFAEAIAKCLKEGKFCKMARSDFRSAFRQLGIMKRQWRFLCMKAHSPIDGEWYYFFDKALPFGSSKSCILFQDFSDSIAFIVQWKSGTGKEITNYLDDFLFIALLKWLCDKQVKTFLFVCREINFPIAAEKTFWGSTKITFLGFLIDSERQMVAVPVEKLIKGRNMVNYVLSKKKITVLQLQKICGFLNFLGRCIVPGRAFTRRLYSNIIPKLKSYHHINISSEMRMDLEMWAEFIKDQSIYNRPFVDYSVVMQADEIDFYTDASKNKFLGFGGYFGPHFMIQAWNPVFIEKCNPSITYLELFALTAAVLAWGYKFANRRVAIFCDNEGVVNILNHSSSDCKNCMVLVRILVLHQMIHNSRIYGKWVSTKKNGPADSLSRLRMDKFRWLKRKHKIDAASTLVPSKIWPIEKIWLY